MCLLLAAHDCCPGYRLVVAANRDEFHARPTAAAAWWSDPPGVLAGRDLEGGGTWLGQTASGRFATVTNVRAGAPVRRGMRSRGLLVTDFLVSACSAQHFAASLPAGAADYDGFNLLAHDGSELVWYSNQAEAPQVLARGIHTLSNARLDTRWPKTERLREGFADVMACHPRDPSAALIELLRDRRRAPAAELPDTGVGAAMESVLSSIFIEGAAYGTRCSTVITIDDADRVSFRERRYDAQAEISGESHHEFELARSAA